MVRGRVELRRIEDRASRQVSFAKRRKGLLKKAEELSVLCDAHVAVLVFSPVGKLYHFAGPSSMEHIIERYQNFAAAEKVVDRRGLHEQSHSKDFQTPGTTDGLLKFADMSIDESAIFQLTLSELSRIERELEVALRRTMARKTQLMMDGINKLQEKGKALPEERNFMETMDDRQQEDKEGKCMDSGSMQSGGVEGDRLLSLCMGYHGDSLQLHGTDDAHGCLVSVDLDLS